MVNFAKEVYFLVIVTYLIISDFGILASHLHSLRELQESDDLLCESILASFKKDSCRLHQGYIIHGDIESEIAQQFRNSLW